MTPGTIAVVVALALIVGAVIYRWAKAKKAGVNTHCSGCSNCTGCAGGHAHEDDGSHTHAPSRDS